MTTENEIKQRMQISSGMFSDRLRRFVRRWAPKDPIEAEEFQIDMTRLMVDAMRHQGECMGAGIDMFASMASSQYRELALRPLVVIREPVKP